MDARKRADGRNPEPRTGSPQRGSPRREHRGVPRAGTSGREGRTGAHACRARVMMDLRAGGCYHDGRAMHGITTLQHMPKRAAAALAIALTLAAGVVGGFAARYVHLPLPWLLGALFTTMALSLSRARRCDSSLGDGRRGRWWSAPPPACSSPRPWSQNS